MPFNENNFMNTAAGNLMASTALSAALRDLHLGQATAHSIEACLQKYTSPDVLWVINGVQYNIDQTIPMLLACRCQVVDMDLQMHHMVTSGNFSASHYTTTYLRRDGSRCEVDCCVFIDSGEDGLWNHTHMSQRILRDTRLEDPTAYADGFAIDMQEPGGIIYPYWPTTQVDAATMYRVLSAAAKKH
jgi:hypothetical protein